MTYPIIAISKRDAMTSNPALAATLQQITCESCGEKLLAKKEMVKAAVAQGQTFVCPLCPRAVVAIRQMELEMLASPAKEKK